MTSTTLAPAAALHVCVDCRALPELPADSAALVDGVEYRPRKPRPAPHGGPRSRRCTTHQRAHTAAQRRRAAATRRVGKYGLTADEQHALWMFQGSACACGRRSGPTPPPGVHLDHDHERARQHDHPEDRGCVDCVTGWLCASCNRDIVGRLTGSLPSRAAVAAALHRLADHLADPPWQRLRTQLPTDERTAA